MRTCTRLFIPFVAVTMMGLVFVCFAAEPTVADKEKQQEAAKKLGIPVEKTLPKSGIVLRLIPAGTFLMGSPESEADRGDNETLHKVTLTKTFYLGKYEVTIGQWKKVMGSIPSRFVKGSENHPICYVNWNDCTNFMKQLAALEGMPEGSFRLPTEAEWEYACRAGTQTAFCYGNDLDSSMAECAGNIPYGNGKRAEVRGGHALVGQFKPNAWGLYDMHGNVGEYCADWYGKYEGDATDPQGPASGGYSVIRGGDSLIGADCCRSAKRACTTPDSRPRYEFGVRISMPAGRSNKTVSISAKGNTELEATKVDEGTAKTIAIDGVSGIQIAEPITTPPSQSSTSVRSLQKLRPVKTNKMVLIPAGTFTMGDTFNEGESSERPTHAVFITAFYMDKYEITKAQWDEVYTWAATNWYVFDNVGAGKATDHPVNSVNWYDCVKWCNARSEKEGLTPCYYLDAAQTVVYKYGQSNIWNDAVKWRANGYRLPTEAEWEKAARGGTPNHRFPWNDSDTIEHARANYRCERQSLDDQSYLLQQYDSRFSTQQKEAIRRNMRERSVKNSYDTSTTNGYHHMFAKGGTPYTSPAGHFAPNAYGLYDMAGNVWEWCWDWRESYYLMSPKNDPRGPVSGLLRVVRGGGWDSEAFKCRTAYRGIIGSPNNIESNCGFRCVREL